MHCFSAFLAVSDSAFLHSGVLGCADFESIMKIDFFSISKKKFRKNYENFMKIITKVERIKEEIKKIQFGLTLNKIKLSCLLVLCKMMCIFRDSEFKNKRAH